MELRVGILKYNWFLQQLKYDLYLGENDIVEEHITRNFNVKCIKPKLYRSDTANPYTTIGFTPKTVYGYYFLITYYDRTKYV